MTEYVVAGTATFFGRGSASNSLNDWATHAEKTKHPEDHHDRDKHADPEKSLLKCRKLLHTCLPSTHDVLMCLRSALLFGPQ